MTAFPEITRPEMARLVEIGNDRFASCSFKPATTYRLRLKGLVQIDNGHVTKVGLLMIHPNAVLTDLGREVLAGFPATEDAS